ncbi:galactokinase [Tribolium castaneum]|uniref:Galactokinase-like Protein n=1 Tax=Tribolium castaneum TaxID=7070 RepID=D6WVS7_TRICA|nr:PREDICTED: galactokinase [Tribolium castaneum]EFA08251.1 Galactokinase-like Protein [Tribolium castaneum]|eukprot:XP_008196620.1 PREDICTED: galactokinase [Tribolium castaneum]
MAENIPEIAQVIKDAKAAFKAEFKQEAEIVVFAPGRVNLIGEHIDYNDGFVMPMALPLVTVIVGKKVSGEETTIITTNPDADPPKKATIEMPNKNALVKTIPPGPPKWSNYVKGVISNYVGETPPAFNALITSTVPTGGGLSSSAALEVATYTFLDALVGPSAVMPTDKALACQKAEHDYANVPCGIMDQFISVLGKKDHALLIDCRSMTSTLIPVADPNVVVLITNSNVKHELTGSEYSSRRTQCQQAALLLKKLSLRDAKLEDIEYLKSINASEETIKRARHAVTEIQRTQEAAEALKKKDFKKFGDLMVASHNSLRDDFEVSCEELDQLVKLAMEVKGVYGSRMTGGGFGGCTVTLVQKSAVNDVIAHVKKGYKGKPTFYICKPSDGAQIVAK